VNVDKISVVEELLLKILACLPSIELRFPSEVRMTSNT
jgi:hypothetical protein